MSDVSTLFSSIFVKKNEKWFCTCVRADKPPDPRLQYRVKIWIYPTAVVLAVLLLIFFSLELHRRPRWIRNFEEEEYGRERLPCPGARFLADRGLGYAA